MSDEIYIRPAPPPPRPGDHFSTNHGAEELYDHPFQVAYGPEYPPTADNIFATWLDWIYRLPVIGRFFPEPGIRKQWR